MNADPGIHEDVIRELKHLTSSQERPNGKNNVLLLLSDSEKQNRVFESCLILLDDPLRRRSAIVFLLFYLSAFPCTTSMLQALHKKAVEMLESPPSESQQLLQCLCQTVEKMHPRWKTVPATITKRDFFTVSDFGLSQETMESADTIVPIMVHSNEEAIQAAQYRNQFFVFQRKGIHFYLRPRVPTRRKGPSSGPNSGPQRVEDYIYQCPLIYNRQHVKAHLRVLNQFWDRYRSNPNVVRASSFLIKIICDSYVSKLPLGEPYSFRSVTMCVLPMLLEWMEGDYLCIRHHVFDFLINLGVHLQMVDSQNVYPGVTEKLEKELSWLLQKVLQQQILVVPYDELTWIAAAKCILVILPPSERSRLDCRLLLQILNISSLAELHPDTFGAFCEAFVQSLLCPSTQQEVIRRKGNEKKSAKKRVIALSNVIREGDLLKLGKKALAKVLSLYCRTYTVGGRLWLFKLIFASAAKRLQAQEAVINRAEWEAALRISLKIFVTSGFFWSWHAQLFYINPQIRAEVTAVFFIPSGAGEKTISSFTRSIYSKLLNILLSIAEENSALPEHVIEHFVNYHSKATISEASVTKAVEDVLQTARLLLKSEGSAGAPDVYNTAWRLLLYVLDIIRSIETEENSLLERFIQVIIVCHQDDFTDGTLIRRVIPDLLTSEFIRWKHVFHGTMNNTFLEKSIKKVWNSILEAYLHNETRPATHRLASLYYNILENLVEFKCSPVYSRSPESSDLTSLLLDRFAIIDAENLEELGIHFFWPLYKGLASEGAVSICRTRQIVVSFLLYLTRRSPSWGHLWKCILDDPYPPVSLIAATRVREICRQLKGSGFEKEDDLKAVWKNVFVYAQSLVHPSFLGQEF